MAAHEILADIVEFSLPHGTMLPPESVMLDKYDIGRGSLREALRVLEVHGVIALRPGPRGGPVVQRVDSEDFARATSLYYYSRRTSLADLLRARTQIDALVTGQAAVNRTEEGLAVLRQLLDEVETASAADDFEYGTLSRQFHAVVAEQAHNDVLYLIDDSLRVILGWRLRGLTFTSHYRRNMLEQHEAIYTAIAAKDRESAEELARSHWEFIYVELNRRFPGLLNELVSWG